MELVRLAWATCLRSPVVLCVAWSGMQFGCLVLLAHLMDVEIYYFLKLDERTGCGFPCKSPIIGGGCPVLESAEWACRTSACTCTWRDTAAFGLNK